MRGPSEWVQVRRLRSTFLSTALATHSDVATEAMAAGSNVATHNCALQHQSDIDAASTDRSRWLPFGYQQASENIRSSRATADPRGGVERARQRCKGRGDPQNEWQQLGIRYKSSKVRRAGVPCATIRSVSLP